MDLHIHTTFSDGRAEMEDYAVKALKIGYRAIAFTDHVCDYSDYLEDYLGEIRRLQAVYHGKLKILAGIESKVISPEGDIDLPRDFEPYRDSLDLVLAAFHRIPKSYNEFFAREEIVSNKEEVLAQWYNTMNCTLQNPVVSGIAHPTAILKEHGIEPTCEQKRGIAEVAAYNSKWLEMNVKHSVPDQEFLHILMDTGTRLFIGSDSHDIQEFRAFSTVIRDMVKKFKATGCLISPLNLG